MIRHEQPVRAAGPARRTPATRSPPPRMGFFTDTSVCIGCKACEVACKEWNGVPDERRSTCSACPTTTPARSARTRGGTSRSSSSPAAGPARCRTAGLPGARRSTPCPPAMPRLGRRACRGRARHAGALAGRPDRSATDFRWLMSSDVCKHCTHAACLDVCPTGALFRTEFGTVVVQEDICNGCGYCVPACPYGVIDQRKDDGRALRSARCATTGSATGMTPACAQACPTESIQFGDARRAAGAGRRAGGDAARAGRRRGPAVRRTTRTTASAATARSSCCWTSRRCTGCRRTRS